MVQARLRKKRYTGKKKKPPTSEVHENGLGNSVKRRVIGSRKKRNRREKRTPFKRFAMCH